MKKIKFSGNFFRKQTNKQTLRILLPIFVLMMIHNSASAQVVVDSDGKVGLHSSTIASGSDLFILGNTRIQNSQGGYIYISDFYGPNIRPGSATTGSVGHSSYPFNEMYAYHMRGYYLYTQYSSFHASDQRIKENFRVIDNPLNKILQLNGRKYDYIPDKFDTVGTEIEKQKKEELKKNKLGFIAQEIKEIIPEAVVFEKEEDRYYIDYDAIIPVIVEAMKEQQAKIELLEDEIDALNGKSNDKSAAITTYSPEGIAASNTPSLGQNIPNPFNVSTRIDIYLPNTIASAKLYIYNMQGSQVKSFNINERGNTSITIEGSSLDAGMYLYTLIADGKEVDTKKMILTK